MPQMLGPLAGAPEPPPNPVRWQRTQCEAIREAGVLTGRYELIDGVIVSKMGHTPPHAAAIGLFLEWLAATFGIQFVRVQLTIDVGAANPDYNEPEPDLAVSRHPVAAYSQRHPGPDDLLLVVEVSDSTLRFDRMTKASLYALAGIEEYWVLDLTGRRLLAHRRPAPDGYQEITAYGADESIAPAARPEAFVRVSDLLP